jgi:glycopeptide antibiotics resistance protein
MRVFLGIVTFLIVYGSLYPFYFEFNAIQVDILKLLFDFNVFHSSFSDSISNIFLFIPFGFLLAKILPKELKAKGVIILTISFVFAYLVQVFQLLTPERVPSGADAVLNTIGALIGINLAYLIFPKSPYIDKIKDTKTIVPIVLAGSLLLLNLAPFMPAIDFYAFKKNIKTLIYFPSIDMFWLLENTTLWLVSFSFLKQADFPKQNTRFLCFVVLAMLMAKFFIQGGGLNYDHLLGGALALFIWHGYKEYLTPKLLLVLLTVMLLGLGLYPFEFSAEISRFHWLPFEGGGNILMNIIALIKKTLIYSSLIYLFYLCGNSLLKATITSALFVFVSEYLQIFFTNSVAEITDAILVLLSGYCIHLIHKHFAERITSNTGGTST